MAKLKERLKKVTENKKKAKWLWIGAGLLVVIMLIMSSAFKVVEAETFLVKKQDVIATVWEKGKVFSKDSKDIYSETQGKATEVRVEIGETVKKGTVLAVVNVSDLEAQISRLEGELKSVQGLDQVAQSQADSSQVKSQQLALEQAELELDMMVSEYERTQKLHEIGAVSKVEMDRAKLQMEAAQKAVSYAEAALAVLTKQSGGYELQYQGQKESLKAQLSYLRIQLDKAVITAEMDGVVFARQIDEGDMVSPGKLLFNIGKTGDFEIRTYINNKDIANVHEGNEITVVFKVPGQDVEAPAVISKISPAAEEIVSSLGITEDRIRITAVLKTQPAGVKIIPGMSVDVVIKTQEAADTAAVPKEAVFSDKGEDFVWAVNNGKAELVKVSTGIEGDEVFEIKSGLQEGDVVLVNPHLPELKQGLRIK